MRSLVIALLATLSLAAAPDGDLAPDFTLPDLSGKAVTLSALEGKKAIVLVFAGIECPRSRAIEPRLGDLAKKYAAEAVFLVINSNWSESAEAIAEHVKRTSFPLPVLKDADNKVADLYRVEVQPTAIVLDAKRRVCYQGLIDDHKSEELVRNPYLARALEALIAGRAVETPSTQALGCAIQKTGAAAAGGSVTYAKQVARILNENCVVCHRQGQVAPFSLESYDKAKAWSQELLNTTKQRSMPPWKPVTNPGFYYNERRLSDEDLATIEAWHRAGAPLGDPKELPPAKTFSDEWMMGTPDAILEAEGGYELPAKGRDEYRCYVIQNPFNEDKWVSGVEYRPGNLRAVHHLIGYLDLAGGSEKKDAADPGPGYRSDGSGPLIVPSGSLAGWAPGNLPRTLPTGTARLLRKGERLVVETHYHKTGRVEKDSGARIGLYFAKEPVKRQLHVHMIINPLVNIPAGAEDHKMNAMWVVPQDVHAYDVMPHMHLIGRAMSVVATLPDGAKQDLVQIKDWDFNWQETYQFKEPLALPRGTRVRLEARYDNSANNLNNPSHPPKAVRWGEQTTDEMCIAFVAFTNDRQDLTKPKPPEEK